MPGTKWKNSVLDWPVPDRGWSRGGEDQVSASFVTSRTISPESTNEFYVSSKNQPKFRSICEKCALFERHFVIFQIGERGWFRKIGSNDPLRPGEVLRVDVKKRATMVPALLEKQ